MRCDPEEVRTRADNRWLFLEGTCYGHDVVALRAVRPPPVEIRQQPGRAFDPTHPHVDKTRRVELSAKILRPMEIRRREVVETIRLVAMLAVPEVLVAHARKRRIARKAASKTVERRRI